MFFNTPDTESRSQVLLSRIVKLQQSIAKGEITPDELQKIARLSPAQLEEKTRNPEKLDSANPTDKAIKTLFALLTRAEPGIVNTDASLMDGLKRFDAEHADYLPLSPLAVTNEQTLAIHLSDFAIFYDVFIRHIAVNKVSGDLEDTYNLTLDTLAARTHWLKWKGERPIRMNFSPERADFPGLFEKFLAGKLRKDEWLTDVDIQRQLKILGITDCHIIPFTEDDLGLALHFAREQHQHDEPPAPYVIPLIVNLGEDGHSRIDSRGNHWVRILVEVDPTDKPAKIKLKYTDELQLHEGSKKKIEATLKNALKYHKQIGSYTSKEDMKFYTAFPDCNDPDISVIGTQEQRDGFTCGYRALRGLIQDLIDTGVIKNDGLYQEFSTCKDAASLRDFVYRSLLGQQIISPEIRTALASLASESDFEEQNADEFKIKPAVVEGQLLAFAMERDKPGRKGKFDGKQLEALVALNEAKVKLQDLPAIKAIAAATGPITLNLQEILKDQDNAELVLDVLFEAIGKNPALKRVTLTGTAELDQKFLQDHIDKLALGIELVSDEPALRDYLTLVNTRNALLAHFNIKPNAQTPPWDALFEAMLFRIADKPTHGRFAWFIEPLSLADKNALQLGSTGFAKLLQYMADNQHRFEAGAFRYDTFSMRDAQAFGYVIADLSMLTTLRDHLQSTNPFLPFKQLSFAITDLSPIDQNELVEVLGDILRASPDGLDRLDIVSSSLASLKEETVQALIDLISAGPYPTVITFSSPDRTTLKIASQLEALENIGLKNQKSRDSEATEKTEKAVAVKRDLPHVTLGKIGKAIFQQDDLTSLSTEIQMQQQQQQQVQQQVQTALDDSSLPEEDELEEELFRLYTGTDELLTRATINKLEAFIKARHPQLSPEQCWDMITGDNADLFKYGIKKISVSAARILIEHLQDVQYGLHPDNLPRGFELQSDQDGNVVLAYSAFDAAINPNESPLTIQFSKPLLPKDWAGNALLFINDKQASDLYKSLKFKKPAPTLDDCIRHFFYLKDDTVKLSVQQRQRILMAFISAQDQEASGKIQALTQSVFGNTLTDQNIKALSEVFFDQGVAGVLQLLTTLQELKRIKGEPFFASFKACFIDSSQNLNELLTENNLTAIQKLMAFSTAQTAWWLALTEQHTSNIGYSPQPKQGEDDGFTHVEKELRPGTRWANLAELAEGFSYFCGQLEEVSPGLHLTEYCPFMSGVADMRVALDRLLSVILPNAHDINEQFYEALPGLSLDALGPFYASRYEGYKLVTPAMMLALGDFTGKAKLDVRFSEKGFTYRCDKVNIGANFADQAVDENSAKQLAIFLRYIATFNHRAPVKRYREAFELIDENIKNNNYFHGKDTLLVLIAVFGTGKRGKHFQKADIDALVNWINQYQDLSKDKNTTALMGIRVMMNAWRAMRRSPIRPTIAEMVTISKQAEKTAQPAQVISMIQELVEVYSEDAQDYIETLTLMCENPNGIGLSVFQAVMRELEGLTKTLKKFTDAEALVLKGHRKLRISTARLLAVCTNEGLEDEEKAAPKIKALYDAVTRCLDKHGEQTTHDLLELLGHIDVKSKTLPTLDQLITIVGDVAANDTPDYSNLEQTIRAALPEGCVIQLDNVVAAPVESGGNLQTIIVKYMGEIIKELAGFKDHIESQLGQNFFKNLATPEGPHTLIKGLEKIGEFSGILGDFVKGKILGVMLKVYDTVINDGIANVGIKDEATRARLAKIIKNKINHPIKTAEFDAFVDLYADELKALSQVLGDLQLINKNWPSDLRAVIAVLDASPFLNGYPLTIIAKITQALVKGFNPNNPFPTDLLGQFLAFKAPSRETLDALKVIVDTVFDPEKQGVWSDSEKRAICELAITYCKHNPQGIDNYLKQVLSLHESNSELFIQKLHILKANQNNEIKTLIADFDQVEELKNPALTQTVFAFFAGDKAADFPAFIKAASQDKPKMALVMPIVLRAAQKELAEKDSRYNQEALVDVVNQLQLLAPNILKELSALYSSPTYPSLSRLAEITSSTSLDLNQLQIEFDRDPFGKRKDEETLEAQFDTRELAGYLNGLQDMNYGRPMLLTQRQELQTWFLYINGIGQKFGIPTIANGSATGPLKTIKDMSHQDIHDLLDYYKTLLNANSNATKEQRLKARLETIALLREVMYRATGNMPRPTQILYLLLSMQTNQNFVGQIKTGEGKSMTAALTAALANLEGKTVDICTSNSFLASEGLEENHAFFEYLGLRVKLITAKSGFDEYKADTIHYSSMSDIALYRSKMQLEGKVFPDNCALIADEVDFSTLDDSTRYRYATALDASADPYHSPYTWIYEALINFTDAQTIPRSDADLQMLAKTWLRNAAKSKEEKQQLKKLEEQPELYQKRLEGWLIAAGKTKQLIDQEETKFRVVTLEHPKYGQVSKACILTGGRPNIDAEFSNGIQQFLHARLRQKYREQIEDGSKADFLVEPEKTYVTSLNSRLLMSTYQSIQGMTGTAGSSKEIIEQYAKYGFRFAAIPQFTSPNRKELDPLLTQAKYLDDPEAEEQEHIRLIVQDILRHISKENEGPCSPVLIQVRDKTQGDKIHEALLAAIQANPEKYKHKLNHSADGKADFLQRFYSSEKPTAQERNEEEKAYKNKAGLDGVITISSVFDRGTDIKPTHKKGLYAVQTYVDTAPHSTEDLERSKSQKVGRSGRKGQFGFTRMILRRSEFKEAYADAPKKLRNLEASTKEVDKAIALLNNIRNKPRSEDRDLRESFDGIKDLVYQEFFTFITAIHATSASKASKKAIINQLLSQWNLVLGRIDNHWEELEHNPALQGKNTVKITRLAEFAAREWNEFAKKDGMLRAHLLKWADHNKMTIELPKERQLDDIELTDQITARKAPLDTHYVKWTDLHNKVSPVSAEAVYADMMDTEGASTELQTEAEKARNQATRAVIQRQLDWLNTPAHQNLLAGKITLDTKEPLENQVKMIMAAMLYLRYKAYRSGNSLGYAKFSKACADFTEQMIWSKSEPYIQAVADAQKEHFTILTAHRGDHEKQKNLYLPMLMAENRRLLSEATSTWKKDSFASWWGKSPAGMRGQAIEWLTSYRDHWWKRSWVSGDRKAVVTTLIEQLNQDDLSATEILTFIQQAKKHLLGNDVKHKRHLGSGSNGRLYNYLNELEIKIHAAMAPEEIDENRKTEFDEVADVLSAYVHDERLPAQRKAKLSKIMEFLEVYQKTDLSIERNSPVMYKKLLDLFEYIGSLPDKDENLQALQDYCQYARNRLVYYFSQGESLSALNKPRSIEVYRALTQAGNIFFYNQTDSEKPPLLNLPGSQFKYNNQTIAFVSKNPEVINTGMHSSFFMQVNQASTYIELLTYLERYMVEKSAQDTRVEFTKIELGNSDHFAPGFTLTVHMLIDDKAIQVDFHLDMKTGAMYTPIDSLYTLDIPKSALDEDRELKTLAEQTQAIRSQWEKQKSEGVKLLDDLQAALDKLDSSVKKRVEQDYKEARAEANLRGETPPNPNTYFAEKLSEIKKGEQNSPDVIQHKS